MKSSNVANSEELWSRPQLERDHPVRTVGGLYRTADAAETGVGGKPLIAAEDAVVAAVRTAYKVAQAHVERSTRLARRLHGGDRAVGGGSERRPADATEDLVSQTMISALNWLGEWMANVDNLLKPMAITQYRLVGSVLGFTSVPKTAVHGTDLTDTVDAEPWNAHKSPREIRVFLKGRGRPVRVCRLEMGSESPVEPARIYFYSVSHIDSEPLEAQFTMDAAAFATLTLSTERPLPSGRWRAAVCSATDQQVGIVEIEL